MATPRADDRRFRRPTEGSAVRRMARGRLRDRRTRPAFSTFLRVMVACLASVFLLSSFATTAGAAASAVVALRYFESLPDPSTVTQRDYYQSTKIYDRNGILLYELFAGEAGSGRRTLINSLNEIPAYVIGATLATEDATFYQNPGFDLSAIARAAYSQKFDPENSSGGSTITQQLARNVLLTPEERMETEGVAGYSRKVKEIALAFQLSQRYSKDDILRMYLNEIFYGNLSYGIEAAAQGYFGKSAKDLSVAEAAMLAGLPARPSIYDPLTNPKIAKERQEEVLDLMVKHNYLDAERAFFAKQEELVYRERKFDIKAPHFVWYVRDLLEERYGGPRLYRGGYTVKTTLDMRLQEMAEEAVRNGINEVRRYNATNASLVAMDPKTGQVLAMVGSADYWDDKIDGRVNVALQERQPGSSIKPVTYVAAFAKGWTPGMTIVDEPISIKDGDKFWRPMNYDNAFHGAMTVREALANSWNIPAVKAIQFVGVETMIEYARRMGETTFKDPSRYGPSITLGGGEVKLLDHVATYSVFANTGFRVPPTPFLEIRDEAGNIIEQYGKDQTGKDIPKERVLSAELAYLITDILSDNNARRVTYGLNSPLKLARPSAAKTGTTDDHRDGWTMGYTPYLAAGVWVGNSDNKPMAGLLGSRSSSPIYNEFMQKAILMFPEEPFERPPGIVEISSCRTIVVNEESGETGSSCRKDIGIRGGEPTKDRFTTRTVLVTKADGKLATTSCKPEDVEQRTFLIPVPGAVLSEDEKQLPKPPTQYADCAKPALTAVAGSTATAQAGATGTPGAIPTSTPGPAGNRPQAAQLSSPGNGQVVRDTVTVAGTADGGNFASYRVEISPGAGGTGSTVLASNSTPVNNGYLATLPSKNYQNGSHTITLTVVDRQGRTTTSTTRVTISN